MTDDDQPELPPPPPQLLDLLRRLEARLDDLDALREDVRNVRSALEANRDIVISPSTIESTARVFPPTIIIGTASGTRAPAIEDPDTREWLSTLRRRGAQGARTADFLSRLVYVAIKLGEAL